MASSFTTEAFTLLGIGIVVIALRTFARATSVGVRSFQFDDYLMCVAAVIYSLETATAYIVGAWWLGLANNGMTDEQRRTLDPHSHEYWLRVGGSKTQLVGWSLYTLLLWTLKLCMCHFYSRLTAGLYHLEIRVKVGYVLIVATYIATELSILLGCQPFSSNWQIEPNPGNHCQPAISKIDLYVTVVLNVLTDMYLMSIPMPMLWKANLEIKRKISLILIFGGGVFVMMAGILRCALIIKDPVKGAQAAGSWACRETFVAVVIGNAPMIYPLFRRGVDKIYSSVGLSHYSHHNYHHHSNGHPLQPSLSKPARRGKLRSIHALPTTWNDNDDAAAEQGWDSKERIIVEGRAVDVTRGKGAGGVGGDGTSSALGGIDEEEGYERSNVARTEMQQQMTAAAAAAAAAGPDRECSTSRTRTHSRTASATGNGLRSARVSVRGSVSGLSTSLGGITVTKQMDIRSEERGEAGISGRTPSPPNDAVVEGFLDVNGAVEVLGRSESRFRYREEDGLEYTAYIGRGL